MQATRSDFTLYVMLVSSVGAEGRASSNVALATVRSLVPALCVRLRWHALFAASGRSWPSGRATTVIQAAASWNCSMMDRCCSRRATTATLMRTTGLDSENPANHLAKIVRIDPATGATTVLAVGVRNCQRLTLDTFDDGPRVSFVDPGGWVSEEIDSIRLADLVDAASPHPPVNFGWGRSAADGRSREGMLFIDHVGNSIGRVPAGEPGFIAPVAEFGREAAKVFAVSGPVSSRASFTRLTFLVADLVGGLVYGITGPPSVLGQPVYHVALVDGSGQTVTLKDLSKADRGDARFFTFPDGVAGVLLEHTGAFYRLTEVK